jgi:hypothetical protein
MATPKRRRWTEKARETGECGKYGECETTDRVNMQA